MIFRVTLKDPDGVSDSIHEAAEDSVAAMDGLDEREQEALIEIRAEVLAEVCGKWFKYGEYLTVEVDTEKKTCVVIEKDK